MVHYAHPEFQEFGLGQQETTSTPQVTQQVTQQVTPQVTPQVMTLLGVIEGEHSREELQELLNLADRENFRKSYLLPALDAGCIERTLPSKPNSRLQKYRLTAKGRRMNDEG